MGKERKHVPIMWVIVIVFFLAVFGSNAITGSLVFSRWFSSTREFLNSFVDDANQKIIAEINARLSLPERINDSYYRVFGTGLLNLTDEQQRDKFFVGVLSSQVENIYSFSFGTPNGEYYGARRNEHGVIEIMRNNAATGGHSWYYSLAEDLTASERVVEAGRFDPRTRDWYKSAVAANGPSFSPIYTHFIMPDLTVSHARPVYNEAGLFLGVLSSHMLLSDLDAFLEKIIQPFGGYAVIIEKKTNKLIANSLGDANFAMLDDGVLERYELAQISNADLVAAFLRYEDEPDPSFLHKGRENVYINFKEIHKPGLDWLLISAIPEEYLITPVASSMRLTMTTLVGFVLLSFAVFIVVIRKLFAPLNDLLAAAKHFTRGDLTKRVEVVRNDEIGKVSRAFNDASEKLQYLVNHLETTVHARTSELLQLSFRDQLTGLCNRRCFYENMSKMDNSHALPLSVIFADINGLKLTNDIFGHAAGDELIKKTAIILQESCRQNDLIARIGGDEFVILLANTNQQNAQLIVERIRAGFVNANARAKAVRCSISLGLTTRTDLNRSLEQIVSEAEIEMYKDKSDSKAENRDIIQTIIERLHTKDPREKVHSENVSQMSVAIGRKLGLDRADLSRLEKAGYLHDIGKIAVASHLFVTEAETKEELDQVRRHVVVGQRILNCVDNMLDLAEYIYSHHENWDGSGYPRGLKGAEIPLLARIIALANAYDWVLTEDEYLEAERRARFLECVKANSGKLFDPQVVTAFLEVMGDGDNYNKES